MEVHKRLLAVLPLLAISLECFLLNAMEICSRASHSFLWRFKSLYFQCGFHTKPTWEMRELVEQVGCCSWPENLRRCDRNQQVSFADILRIYNVFVKMERSIAYVDFVRNFLVWIHDGHRWTFSISTSYWLMGGLPERTSLSAEMRPYLELLPILRFGHGIIAKGLPNLLGDLSFSYHQDIGKTWCKISAWWMMSKIWRVRTICLYSRRNRHELMRFIGMKILMHALKGWSHRLPFQRNIGGKNKLRYFLNAPRIWTQKICPKVQQQNSHVCAERVVSSPTLSAQFWREK